MTAITSAEAPEASRARTPAYSWLVLFMLCITYMFNFLDRQLMSILTEMVRKEMNLTDRQMGLLGGIYFAMFYTVIGVIIGYIADRTSRVRVLATGATLWSLFTMLCGSAGAYPTLMVARMGVGVGEAAGSPPSYSIISDYFPPHKRGMALGLYSVGVPLGLALGAAAGGRIAAAYGWRTAFHAIGAAGLVSTLLLILIVREPKRGAQDGGKAVSMPKVSFIQTAKDFLGRPLLLSLAVAAGFVAFVGYGQLNWTAPFLARCKGINMKEIALWYALELAICMGVGTYLAGVIADRLAKRARYWYALMPACAMTIALPFYVAFVSTPTWQMALVYMAVPTLMTQAYLAPALVVIQNSVKPAQRGMAGALFLLILNFIGLGFGPTFVGEMSTHYTETLGSNVAGLQMAMYWIAPFYVVAVLFLCLEGYFLHRESKRDAVLANAS